MYVCMSNIPELTFTYMCVALYTYYLFFRCFVHTQIKKIRNFLDDKKNPEILPEEDRFIFEVKYTACVMYLLFLYEHAVKLIYICIPYNTR